MHFVTSRPITIPLSAEQRIVARTAGKIGHPLLAIKNAQRILTKATCEPTDRSIPPINSTYITPTAVTPIIADCRKIFMKLLNAKNLGVMIPKKRTMAIRIKKIT